MRENTLAREERKANLNEEMEAQMEGASKKQKRNIKKMYEKHSDQQKAFTSRKYLFIQPSDNWPRPPGKFLSMDVVGTKPNGQKILSFKKSQEYHSL